MKTIIELLAALPSDSIRKLPLAECCNILDNRRKPVTRAAREKGEYPYYGANGIQDYVSDYLFEGTFVLVGEDGSVITEFGKPVVNWAEGKIWVNNHAHIIEYSGVCLLRYLYYYLQTVNIKDYVHGNIPKFTQGDFKSLVVMVPPVEIQREIVDILDELTEASGAVTDALDREAACRKKQYDFYKDNLLSFDGATKIVKLGDIAQIVRGASPRPIKSFITDSPDGVNWIKIGDASQNDKYITSCAEKITQEGAKKSRQVKPGDFILSNSMSFGRPYILKISGCIHDGWLAISDFEDHVTADYLYHVLTSNIIQETMKKKASFGGAVQNLNADIVRSIEIPVPSLETQRDIVEKLDALNEVTTELIAALVRERDLRAKQYVYCRDRVFA